MIWCDLKDQVTATECKAYQSIKLYSNVHHVHHTCHRVLWVQVKFLRRCTLQCLRAFVKDEAALQSCGSSSILILSLDPFCLRSSPVIIHILFIIFSINFYHIQPWVQPAIFTLLQVQSSPRLAVLLRSPKVAWHRLQWRGQGEQARIVTKWELNSYKSELIPSPGNSIFGKATASSSSTSPSRNSNENKGKTAGAMECPEYPQKSKTTNERYDLVIDEEEECKVQ